MFNRRKFSEKLDKSLAEGRNRKLKENVYARFLDSKGREECAIQYYDTIVTYFDSHGATVNLGGFDTVTTRAVLNAVLNRYGMNVYHLKGQTYFSNGVDTVAVPNHGLVWLPYSRVTHAPGPAPYWFLNEVNT